MIFITAKFQIRPEDADQWPQIAAEFTEATRSEPGARELLPPASHPRST